MSELNALSIVSIQYELILTLRHGDDLISMINRFLRTCIKRVGAANVQFYFKPLFPEWDNDHYLEENNLENGISRIPLRTADVIPWEELYDFLHLELDEKPDQHITYFQRFGRHCYAIVVPPVGVLVIQKNGTPFDPELTSIIEQVTPKLSECCNACIERETLRREIALRKRIEDQLQSSKQKAEEASFTDFLTGLSNRRALASFLETIKLSSSAGCDDLGILLIDLDNFKRLNDRYGHNAGDRALDHVADVVRRAVQPGDFAGRIGGDEFLIILRAPGTREDLEALADTIIARISKFDHDRDYNCGFGASIGLSRIRSTDQMDVVNVTADADEALYEAKRGRNECCFFDDELRAKTLRRSSVIDEIRNALARGDFVPYMQPQVSLRDGSIIGAEALVRWKHPEEGLITPAKFLPLAGDVGLLDSIDAAIFRAGLLALRSFDEAGFSLPKMSFNVTASKLSNRSWLEYVCDIVRDLDLTRDRVTLEFVESIMFDGDSYTLVAMARKSVQKGFQIHLDDFGTGHASISALRQLPFSCVKIDKAFVRGIDKDRSLREMMGGIIKIIHGCRMTALAEGVETREEAETLRTLGVDFAQGFYFAKPMPVDDMRSFLASSQDQMPMIGQSIHRSSGVSTF